MQNPLYIKDNERGLLIGATGSGKSYLAKYVLSNKSQLLVIDPKGDFILKGRKANIYRTPKELMKWKGNSNNEYAIYRPTPQHDESEDWDVVFKFLFYKKIKNKRPFIYIDEAYLVLKSPLSYSKFLKAIYNQGRGLGIGILAASQRPKGIPIFMRSENSRVWLFRLNDITDIKYMASVLTSAIITNPVKGHQFYFKTNDMEKPVMCIIGAD
jgi:energy-coupling factor transporter ATP-binding protein EcfA2